MSKSIKEFIVIAQKISQRRISYLEPYGFTAGLQTKAAAAALRFCPLPRSITQFLSYFQN